MGRNRVLSFMSQLSLSGIHRDSRTPTPTSSPPHGSTPPLKPDPVLGVISPPPPPYSSSSSSPNGASFSSSSPINAAPSPEHANPEPVSLDDSPSVTPQRRLSRQRPRSSSRPLSMVQAYQPPVMDVNEDTIPELQPIFTLLNSHANKLYQEGYFLKLDDQNSQGRPNPDRTWTECFAQLVGTVLSLWDAAELDAAGDNGEVLPKFINLTDASIKMIESLPTRSNDEQPLQNILSISTAGRNRYLLHFNSHHSLIQWTAGIRLAMFEQSTLQEAYTGALIAGKGKTLNNINLIMERSRFKTEEWVRVRFGAGVPWRRCWCVISPPDEKEYQKLQKDLKKKSPYDRSHAPILKGDIKFYDTRKEGKKQKKAKPIASITEAYSAYAIYPQAKSLIDASTLIKIEGNITIHSDPPSSTEGFVFIMPEVHPAVSGFEMLLRFLFPTWDTFGLYGRPGRLVASVLDPRSLMFAMPKHKRYGYLEILDVTGLILTEGSSSWSEREWRKKLKELTGQRMTAMEEGGGRTHGRSSSRSSKRLSLGPGSGVPVSRPRVGFADDTGSVRSSRSLISSQPGLRTDSAPPASDRQRIPSAMANVSGHARNHSDTGLEGPLLAADVRRSPSPQARKFVSDLASTPERVSSEDERAYHSGNTPVHDIESYQRMQTPEPVHAPPAFAHQPSSRPAAQPYDSPELRKANSRLSNSTLDQLAKAGGVTPGEYYSSPDGYERHSGEEEYAGPIPTSGGRIDPRGQAVHPHANPVGMTAANAIGSREALTSPSSNSGRLPPRSPGLPPPNMALTPKRSKSPLNQSFGPLGSSSSPAPPRPGGSRPVSPETRNVGLMPEPLRPGMSFQDQSRTGPAPPGGQPSPMFNPVRRLPEPPSGATSSGTYSPAGPQGPYMGRGAPMPPPHGPLPSPPGGPLPQRVRTPPPGATRGEPLPPLQTSPPINRKPVPQSATSVQRREEDSASESIISSNDSLRDLVIDESALAQVHPVDSNDGDGSRTAQGQRIMRQNTQWSEGSRYDDASSTTSPDYASTRKSSETQESVERPRAGVLRTIGVDEHPLPERPAGFDIPKVDFGPTYNYSNPNIPKQKLAGSPLPGSPVQFNFSRTFSPAPGRRPVPAESPPEYTHARQASDDTIRRSVAWQPGSAVVGSPSSERPGAISPEQFVQQRAAAASAAVTPPLFSHQRNPSGATTSRNNTPTPPLRRRSSYDILNAAGGHSRSSSADLLGSRPGSRGANGALNMGAGMTGTVDMSSHLSAREQEHIARITGTPLISMAGNRSSAENGGPGLVGAIAARERERQQIKEGVSSQVLQEAIHQRMQHQQAQQYAQQQQLAQQQAQQAQQQQLAQQQLAQRQYAQMYGMASPMGSPGPNMYGASSMSVNNMQMGGNGGGYQLPPGHGPPQSRPVMMAGAPQGTGPGGVWMRPGPQQMVAQETTGGQYAMSPQQGYMSSPMSPQMPAGPYGAPGSPQRPGTPGNAMNRRSMMYQGQAF